MMYDIEFKPGAAKQFRKLSPGVQRRLAAVLEELRLDPRPRGARKLSGGDEGIYRVRSGDYRILYQIEDDWLLILVVAVDDRKDIYR